MGYSKIDLSKLNFSKEIVSLDEALENIAPFEIPDEVLNGEKNILVTDGKTDSSNERVNIE